MQTALSMVEPMLQEKGCLSYQGIEDENVFSMIQKEVMIVFGNEIGLNAHNFK